MNFTLGILVYDHGTRPLEARAQLHIMVRQIENSSTVKDNSTKTKNKLIVIAIITASSVIIVSLMIAIAVIKYCYKRQHTTMHDSKPTQNYYESASQNDLSNKQLYNGTQVPNMDDSIPTSERNYIFADYTLPDRGMDTISGYNVSTTYRSRMMINIIVY